jgi:hypothetical protein
MPRTASSSVGGYCDHVLNRGNGRATVFHKPQDYQAFVALIAEAGLRQPIRLLAYCVMPDHFPLAGRAEPIERTTDIPDYQNADRNKLCSLIQTPEVSDGS